MNESRWRMVLVLIVVAAGAGCGNDGNNQDAPPLEADAAPDRGQECAPELPGPIDPSLLIDDLEDRDRFIAPVAGRTGGWSVYADESGGTLEPPAGSSPVPARIIGGRCGSEFAMRISGQGFSEWGAGMNVGFRFENADLGVYDASRYAGVRFWARTGETHTSSVRVRFQDRNTYPVGGICDPGDLVGANACYNAHGQGLVPLGNEWRLYEIAFDRVTQENLFGSPSPFETAHLFSLEWLMQPGSVMDLWIDDVWFYE
jgi:endoglucanase